MSWQTRKLVRDLFTMAVEVFAAVVCVACVVYVAYVAVTHLP